MKRMLMAVLGFYMVLATATVFADPATIAGDTYRITNYIEPEVQGSLNIELVFTDEFMDRLGPGDQDTSLLGIEYSIYYNAPLAGPIQIQTGDTSFYAPSRFYIEYDASGNPALMIMDGGPWDLSADFAFSTAEFSDILGSYHVMALELIVDGEPYDDPRPAVVDPEALALQQALLDYYTRIETEDNPNRLRTLVHMSSITQYIKKLREARARLGEQAVLQPWP